MNILDKIKTYKLEEVAGRKQQTSLSDLESRIHGLQAPRGFMQALIDKKPDSGLSLIAEIKKASPSKGLIRPDFDPLSLAIAYQSAGAACLSILTDAPSFMGHESYFEAARSAVALPCIRKDFMIDTWQIAESRAMGADCILIIMAMIDDGLAHDLLQAAHDYGMDALIEVHDGDEMLRALKLNSKLLGINNRNLKTFDVNLNVTEALADMAGSGHVLVSESGIFTPEDVRRMEKCGATAMLVGESLMRQEDVKLATETLMAV